MTAGVTLSLIGPVRLIARGGRDLTPCGRKARAALALIGTSPGLRITRTRLQDRLWSDRAPEQGAASLRQMVRELRTALAPEPGLLVAEAGSIGLDPVRVEVDLAPRLAVDGTPVEFADDLDIPDPEFEDWLRDTRLRLEDRPVDPDPRGRAPAAPAGGGVTLLEVDPPVAADGAGLSVSMLLEEAAWRATEMMPGRLELSDRGPGSADGGGFRLSGLGTRIGPNINALVVLSQAGRSAHRMARRLNWPADDDGGGLARAVAQLAVAVVGAIEEFTAAPQPFSVWDLFSYSGPRLAIADRALAAATPSAATMALRAFLQTTRVFERLTPDPARAFDEAARLSAEARALGPANAVALGVSSLVAGYGGRGAAAAELATAALRADPWDDFARLGRAQALADAGRLAEARAQLVAMEGGMLATIAPPAVLMRRAMVELRAGALAEAEATAAAAHVFAPENRPALRTLAALRYARGDEAGAAQAVALLREVEPGFSPRRLSDPDYPAHSLRAAGLIRIAASGL